MFHYVSSGLSNVWLRNGFTEKETAYGKAVSIHDLEGLHKAIGLYIVTNLPSLAGEEVQFIRKELDITQQQMAYILGVSETTVRNWENNRTKRKMPKSAEIVLRALYSDYVSNNGNVRDIVDGIGQMNRESFANSIEFEETDAGWRTAA